MQLRKSEYLNNTKKTPPEKKESDLFQQKIFKKKEFVNKKNSIGEKKKKEIIEAKKKELKKSSGNMTQITVINKSNLSLQEEKINSDKERHSDIKKDVQMVKKNIENKIKKNELAKIREEEIKNRKFSYFKEKSIDPQIDEDKTKLFYDENVLKKSFLKNDQLNVRITSKENKKKLPRKNTISDENKMTDQNEGGLVTALNSSSSVMEIKEFKFNEKRETLSYNEQEIKLGIKQKKRIIEFITTIVDDPVKIVISSTFPQDLNQSNKERKKLKTRALNLRIF